MELLEDPAVVGPSDSVTLTFCLRIGAGGMPSHSARMCVQGHAYAQADTQSAKASTYLKDSIARLCEEDRGLYL
jgi:hypothetical protein